MNLIHVAACSKILLSVLSPIENALFIILLDLIKDMKDRYLPCTRLCLNLPKIKNVSISSRSDKKVSLFAPVAQKKTSIFSQLLLLNRNSCNKCDGDGCFRQLPLNCLTESRRHLRQLPISGYLPRLDLVGSP